MSWVGGKKALRDEIVARFPLDYKRYIEVFGGGGWVLFHKNPGKDFEVYNDFNGNLVNLYRCVRENPDELKAELEFILALLMVLTLVGCDIEQIPTVAQKLPVETTIPTESETEATQSTVPTESTAVEVPPDATQSLETDPKDETKPTEPPAVTVPETKPTQPAETTPPETVPPTTQPPASTEPTQPPATEPAPTNPPATEPEATTPSTPPVTEPVKPEKKEIDIAAIESSANSYAQSLGFIIDTSMGKGNSGYYPPDYRPLESTEEGCRVAAELVDATKDQLNSRFSTEYSNVLVEEAYGYARVSCVVKFSHTDELGDWYYMRCCLSGAAGHISVSSSPASHSWNRAKPTASGSEAVMKLFPMTFPFPCS